MGPEKWTYFYLYVIIDIFSRRVVGWCVADAESAALFKPLFQDAAAKHAVLPGQLTLHADCGPSMKAKATRMQMSPMKISIAGASPSPGKAATPSIFTGTNVGSSDATGPVI
jgi:putative transposase